MKINIQTQNSIPNNAEVIKVREVCFFVSLIYEWIVLKKNNMNKNANNANRISIIPSIFLLDI